MKILGIGLIVIGIVMLVFRGFNFTQEKKVVDLGPVEINKKENKEIGLARICRRHCGGGRRCSANGRGKKILTDYEVPIISTSCSSTSITLAR